jgi:site-specific DNA recombinase
METSKLHCVIDCRVSDEQQLKNGSLDNQEVIGRLTALKLGIPDSNIKVFKKPHSATTTERDDFQEILDFIKDSGKNYKYYIVKSLDRLTREGYPEFLRLEAELEKLGVRIIDAQGIIQPKQNSLSHLGDFEYKWSIFSPSEAGVMLETYKGKAEVRDILTRLVGAEIKLVQEGYSVRRPPDGLKNKPILMDGKKKVIREAGDRAHFFQKMLEMRAGGVDDKEIVDLLNAMGFKTQSMHRWDKRNKEHPKVIGKVGGNPLTIKQLQRYIKQTEYAGVNYEKWTRKQPVKMQQFDGIVTVDTFNKANRGKVFIQKNSDVSIEILHDYSPWGKIKRIRNNPDYPAKWVLCPHCQQEMLASASKGKSGIKFPAYHCGGVKEGKRAHSYLRITKKEFEDSTNAYLDKLRFEDGFFEELEQKLIVEYRKKEKDIVIESSAISRSVSELKAEQAKKLDSFENAESATTRRILEAQIEKLDRQIKEAEGKRGQIETNEKSIKAFIQYAKHVMEHPAEIIDKADNMQSRKALLSLFFEEIPTYQEILNGTPKLTLLFKLSEEFKIDKTQLVTLRGIEPRF